MTLILAQASRWFALEVSDRLVTQGGRPFDRASNKNVLFVAHDAVVALGYTGSAYIEGVPTDQWIAEVLIGQTFERGQRPPSMCIGAIPSGRHIGPALRQLVDRLTSVFKATNLRTEASMSMFGILGTGWQWGRRGVPRPIVIGIEKPAGQSGVNLWRSARHFGRSFISAATPEGNLQPIEVDRMRSELRSIRTPDEAEGALVDTIRSVSRHLSYVGPDCMSILIPPPPIGWARVRYIPVSPATLAIRSRSDGSIRMTAPAAFSPWVVSPGLVHAPSVLSGQMTLSLGNFAVHLEAPEPQGPGLRGAMGAVDRPALPR